jgi:hypothetical protein
MSRPVLDATERRRPLERDFAVIGPDQSGRQGLSFLIRIAVDVVERLRRTHAEGGLVPRGGAARSFQGRP